MIVTAITTGVAVGFGAKFIASSILPMNVVLPQIKVSPQEIFTNQIAMLDVNFVNPHDSSDFQLVAIDEERES